MPDEEDRIALFLDFENLAIGAKERGEKLDIAVIIDALAGARPGGRPTRLRGLEPLRGASPGPRRRSASR